MSESAPLGVLRLSLLLDALPGAAALDGPASPFDSAADDACAEGPEEAAAEAGTEDDEESEGGWYHDAYDPIPREPIDWSRRAQSCVHFIETQTKSVSLARRGGKEKETRVDRNELEHPVLSQHTDDRLLARLIISVDKG